MAKPTIVCVPGAWHSPEAYSRVLEILDAQGYPTIGLPLPSVGATLPDKGFADDIEAIRNCLTQLVVSEEKEAVLVMHSYGCMPGTEAPIGLGRKERERKGLKGGIVRLVYIAGYAMPEGFDPTSGAAQIPDWMKMDAEKGIVTVDPGDAKRIFYNDISSAEGDKWVSKLTHQSLGVFHGWTQTYAAWRHMPSTYVFGAEDQSIFTPELARAVIKAAQQLQPKAFGVVEECDAGHCLMISQPEWLADVLRRAAGEAC